MSNLPGGLLITALAFTGATLGSLGLTRFFALTPLRLRRLYASLLLGLPVVALAGWWKWQQVNAGEPAAVLVLFWIEMGLLFTLLHMDIQDRTVHLLIPVVGLLLALGYNILVVPSGVLLAGGAGGLDGQLFLAQFALFEYGGGALFIGGTLALAYWFSNRLFPGREAFGVADIYLGAMLGAVLGLESGALALILGVTLNGLVALVLIVGRHFSPRVPQIIPYLPGLIVPMMLVMGLQ